MEDDANPPPPESEPGGDGANNSVAPADATCWICLDGGDGLQRSCACRGPSAGYAHLDCIATYAGTKLADVLSGPATSKRGIAGLASYTTCPTCNKWYTGEMLERLTTDLARALEHLPMSNHARSTAVFVKARAHIVSKPEVAADEYRSLLVEENDFHELTMKAMVALVLIEFRTGNAESIAKQLNETNAFYNTHRQYFERRGLGREKFGLLGTLDDMIFNTSEETAQELLNARESGNLKGNDENMRLLFALCQSEQYIEALKLSKNLLNEIVQEFGPEHQDTLHMIGMIDFVKEKYRAYLLERRK